MAAEEMKFSLNVMVNRENTKVLFADVDNSFSDVLLSFLTLPLGTIVRLLGKHYGDEAPAFGSLTNLYCSVENLDESYFRKAAGKKILLNPRNSFHDECRKLKLNIDDTERTKYFVCADRNCRNKFLYASLCSGLYVCVCGEKMNREISITITDEDEDEDDDGVLTEKTMMSFVISDGLRMVPNFARLSFVQSLSNIGIKKISGAKHVSVDTGFNEIMGLLRASLSSSTPLTDILLCKTQTSTGTIKFEPVHYTENEESPKFGNMVLRAVLQKSTGKLLFAQAEDDFVDFVFGFLAIPLGGVEWLLGGNTSLGNIDNLYHSLVDLKEHLKVFGNGNSLLKPEISHTNLSKNHSIFNGQAIPELYHHSTLDKLTSVKSNSSQSEPLTIVGPNGLNPKGGNGYISWPCSYIVRDDLTITPLTMHSRVSVLEEMKVGLSDVREVEFEIGMEEALNILKASLTSTRALSNSLYSVLMKQQKRESPESEYGVRVYFTSRLFDVRHQTTTDVQINAGFFTVTFLLINKQSQNYIALT